MKHTQMKWPLNDSNFNFLDRLRLAVFFLNKKNFWTMANEVEKFEAIMRDFADSKYAVFVSSGSTANTILAMYLKDRVYTKTRNTVVVPSTTWITSVAPFIREGFKPQFIDINLNDNLGMDLDLLEEYLKDNHKKVACVFITTLVGFGTDIERLKKLEEQYKVKIMLDNCESTLSFYKDKNISSYFTSTTSTYFGHQIQSVEGGFIFTNNQEEYEYFLMARNHGMVRGLKSNHEKYANYDVDQRFDFNFLGNNFRNTNINAFIGRLDFKRVGRYINDRRRQYKMFELAFESSTDLKVIKMHEDERLDVPFCIPLIFKDVQTRRNIEKHFMAIGVETRPIISGNLLRQTCFKGMFNPSFFKNSEYIHEHGFYIGLHSRVKDSDLLAAIDIVNSFIKK